MPVPGNMQGRGALSEPEDDPDRDERDQDPEARRGELGAKAGRERQTVTLALVLVEENLLERTTSGTSSTWITFGSK